MLVRPEVCSLSLRPFSRSLGFYTRGRDSHLLSGTRFRAPTKTLGLFRPTPKRGLGDFAWPGLLGTGNRVPLHTEGLGL